MNWPRAFKALLSLLNGKRPLIIDPPRELIGRLPERAPCMSLDYAVWRHLDDHRQSSFSADLPDTRPDAAVLFQPRAHERLAWWLHRLAERYPGLELWIAGANAEGGRSIGGRVESALAQTAQRVASLGRASIWQCRLPETPPPAPDPWRVWQHEGLRIHALPGVFGYQGTDDGTALLIETVRRLKPSGRVLDFGCGTGIVTAVTAHLNPDARLTLADSDALALASAGRTLETNGLAGDIRPCDGWQGLDGAWDWILANPPFHVGASADLSVALALIQDAPQRLETGGRMVLVANRHLPLETPLERAFGNLVKLAENTHFKVLSACRQ